jgi:hypothetical protein
MYFKVILINKNPGIKPGLNLLNEEKTKCLKQNFIKRLCRQ